MENPRAFGIFFSGLFLQQAVLNLNIYLLFIYTLDIVLKCLQSVKKIHLERNISCQYCNSANWKIIDVQIRCV